MQLLRIDWNVVWTIINLLVLFVALRHFLYNPVMKVMDERKKMIDGQIADAENQKKQAGELKAQYAKKLEEAHAESADIMDKARKSAQAEYENQIRALTYEDITEWCMSTIGWTGKHHKVSIDLSWEQYCITVKWEEWILNSCECLEILCLCHTDCCSVEILTPDNVICVFYFY